MSHRWRDSFVSELLAHQAPSESGLAVYHNNLRGNFRKALELSFPTLQALTGPEYFAQLADAYRHRHPSRSGDLHEVGAAFPEFLAARFQGQRERYWADLAALEWAWQHCLVAADETPLNAGAFAAIDQEQWPRLRLRLQPSLGFVSSPFPVVTIWQRHREYAADLSALPEISLDQGAELAWLAGTPSGPRLELCSASEQRWLEAINQGQTLTETLEQVEQDFLLGDVLARILSAGLIVEVIAD